MGPSTEDPVLSPLNSLGLFQEDMEETSSMSGLAPDLSGESSGDPVCAGSGKRVLREESCQGASSQAVGAPGASPEATAHPVVLGLQTVGQNRNLVPSSRLRRQLPTEPAQWRAQGRDWFPCTGAVLSLAQTHRGRPQTTSTPFQCSWASLVAQLIKNLPSKAGNVGLIPGQGTKIPHAMGHPG